MLSVMDLMCSELGLERGPKIATTPFSKQGDNEKKMLQTETYQT